MVNPHLEAELLGAGVHSSRLAHTWGSWQQHGFTQRLRSSFLQPSLTLEVSTVPRICSVVLGKCRQNVSKTQKREITSNQPKLWNKGRKKDHHCFHLVSFLPFVSARHCQLFVSSSSANWSKTERKDRGRKKRQVREGHKLGENEVKGVRDWRNQEIIKNIKTEDQLLGKKVWKYKHFFHFLMFCQNRVPHLWVQSGRPPQPAASPSTVHSLRRKKQQIRSWFHGANRTKGSE